MNNSVLSSEGAVHYVNKPFSTGFAVCVNCGKTESGKSPDKCSFCGSLLNQKPISSTTEEYFRSVTEEAFSLWQKKHLSYGPYNISVFGIKGIAVRLWDKMQRVVRLGWNNVENPLEETLIDTFLDIAVYALIAILVIRNQWPKSPFEVKV